MFLQYQPLNSSHFKLIYQICHNAKTLDDKISCKFLMLLFLEASRCLKSRRAGCTSEVQITNALRYVQALYPARKLPHQLPWNLLFQKPFSGL